MEDKTGIMRQARYEELRKQNRIPEGKDILKINLLHTEEFQQAFNHIQNLLNIIDDLIPNGNNNPIKSRKVYTDAKQFIEERNTT